MREDLPIAMNPEGTVGVGVIDGAYGEASSTSAIRQEVQSYLLRSGLEASPMPFNMLVDERIARPARAASLFSKLPQGVQDAIHNKRDSLSGPKKSAQQ